jgi:hypothetical protein
MKLIKAVILFGFSIYCIPVNCQTNNSSKLRENIKSLKSDVTTAYYLSIDSILDSDGNLQTIIKKEFKEINTFFSPNNYYLFKIGYYINDSNYAEKTKMVFENLKKYIKNIKSKKIIKVDANCQDYLGVPSDAKKYEDLTGNKLKNSILIVLYKSNNKIEQRSHKKHCYL